MNPMQRAASMNSTFSDINATQNSILADSVAGVVSGSVSHGTHFGVSSAADPIRPATAKRVGASVLSI